MPTLNWIGKEAVVKHHKEVPFRLLEPVSDLSCGDNRECRDTEASDLTTARTMADVSTVAFVVGGVGAAVGVVGLLSPSTVRVRKGSLTIEPYVAGTGGGIHGTF